MTWNCVGWTDAHKQLNKAFATQNLSISCLSTSSFIESRGKFNSNNFIFASSFSHYNALESAALCEKFVKLASELVKKTVRPRVIFVSSAAVYGLSTKQKLYDENAKLQPSSTYSKEKVLLEAVLSKEAIDAGGSCIILRPAGLFGKTGIMARNNNLVDRLIEAILSGEQLNISIENNGQQIRDFVHIHDLLNVIAQAASHFDEIVPPLGKFVLNVSNGLPLQVSEIVEAARERALSIKAIYKPATTDAIHCALNTAKLNSLFDRGAFQHVIKLLNDT